jgi:hypothetical protein
MEMAAREISLKAKNTTYVVKFATIIVSAKSINKFDK